MGRILIALAVISMAGICACDTRTKAYVTCNGVGAGYKCTVEHRGGPGGKICWRIVVDCNGSQGKFTTKAKACQVVRKESRSIKLVPLSAFKNAAACTGVTGIRVEVGEK